jgi:hypothetical protein
VSQFTKILIGAGAVAALLAVIFIALGNWGSSVPESQEVEMSFGNHLVTVKGHYKDLTQELLADGLTIAVDGNKITVTGDQVTAADGLTHDLEPDQNVEIVVDEKGAVHVSVEAQDAGGAAAAEAAPE